MSKKMTPWFPSRIKPVRAGVYETKWDCAGEWEHGFSYWDGFEWANGSESPEGAYQRRSWAGGAVQDKKWRGFKEKQA